METVKMTSVTLETLLETEDAHLRPTVRMPAVHRVETAEIPVVLSRPWLVPAASAALVAFAVIVLSLVVAALG